MSDTFEEMRARAKAKREFEARLARSRAAAKAKAEESAPAPAAGQDDVSVGASIGAEESVGGGVTSGASVDVDQLPASLSQKIEIMRRLGRSNTSPGGLDLNFELDDRTREAFSDALTAELERIGVAPRLSMGRAAAALADSESLPEVDPATLIEQNVVVAGAFVEGLHSMSSSIARMVLPGIERNLGIDTEGRSLEAVGRASNPAPATLGEDRFRVAQEAVRSTALGRITEGGARFTGIIPSLKAGTAALGPGNAVVKGFNLGRAAGPTALALHSGLSAVDQGPGAAVAAAGQSAIFLAGAEVISKPLAAWLSRLPVAKHALAKQVLGRGASGISFAGAGELLAGLEGEELIEAERKLTNLIFGVGAGGKIQAKPPAVGRRARKILKKIKKGALERAEVEPVVEEPVEAPGEAPKAEGVAEAPKPVEAPTEALPKPVEPAKAEVAPEPAAKPPVEPPKPPVEALGEPVAKAEGDTTSLKNADTNRKRQLRNLPELVTDVHKSNPEVVNAGLDAIRENSEAGHNLVRDLLADTTRTPRLSEQGVLLVHKGGIEKNHRLAVRELERAQASGDVDAIEAAMRREGEVQAQLNDIEVVSHGTGREQGRTFQFRQAMKREDDSLASLTRKRIAANRGKPLTPEQAAEVKNLHTQLSKVTAERDAQTARVIELESRKDLGASIRAVANRKPPSPTSKEFGARNRLVSRKGMEEANADWDSELAGARSGIPLTPKALAAAGKVGVFYLEGGLRKFADFSKAVVETLGEGAKPHLRAIWNQSRTSFKEQLREDTAGALAAGVAEGRGLGEMKRQVHELAEGFVRAGVTKREPLIDAVHEVLKGADPEITRRETMDAISGFGDFRPLNPDPVKAELRELKGQMQQIAKLEEMAGGKAPPKTGPERQAPGEIQRELIRQVNEAKRKGGFDVTDPARQLRSAEDALQRRLDNQIKDLETEIRTGKELESRKKRTRLAPSERIKALTKRRNELKKQRDALFPKRRRALTDEQRLKVATRAVEKSLAEIERRIKDGDLFAGRKTLGAKDAPTSAELDALRARRDARRAELTELQQIARPARTREEVLLQSMKTRRLNQIADLTGRLARQDFTPTPRREPIKPTAEIIALDAELDIIKRKFNEALIRDRLKNRSLPRKLLATVPGAINLSKAVITSMDLSAGLRQGGFVSIGRPILAAKAFVKSLEALSSVAGQARVEARIRRDPNFDFATRTGGLEITETGVTAKLTAREETIMSNVAEKIPLVAASQRQFGTFLNQLRMDTFNTLARSWSRTGQPTPAEAKVIANYVNVATGRGLFAGRGNTAATLSTVFWAPRLAASRFQLLVGQPLWTTKGGFKGTLKARALVATEYARFLIGLGTVYGLAQMMGGEVETDVRSSDFGKVRFGNTRVDFLAGIAQSTVLLGRLGHGETKRLTSKEEFERGVVNEPKETNRLNVGIRYLRTKVSPVFGAVANILDKKNLIGEPTTPLSVVGDLTIPLSMRDIFESLQEQGLSRGAALSLLVTLGAGVQNFNDEQRGPPAKPSRSSPGKRVIPRRASPPKRLKR